MTGRRVVAVAHFPPPVHGMAVAVDRLVSELETLTTVRRVNIAAPTLERSVGYHMARIGRVLRALVALAVERRRSSTAFFSCDAGTGMLYTLALTTWARLWGYRMHLQHHSYAYLNRRSGVLALLVRLTGDRCVHLLLSSEMLADFRAVYPTAPTRVIGIAGGLEFDSTSRQARSHLVLGFLGNVSVEKGLDLVLATGRAAVRAGVPVEVRVAGPVVDPVADELLTEAATDPDVTLVRTGPVYGPERDAFLDELDVFLFPSRYANEAFALVVWEAMARGAPVILRGVGCLTVDAIGEGGRVVDPGDDFVRAAVETLELWWTDRTALETSSKAAHDRALAVSMASAQDTASLCRELAGHGSVDRPGGLSAPELITRREAVADEDV